MNEKVIGHLLLWGGIAIMIFSLINIFMVFTGRLKPITVIHLTSTQTSSTGGFDISAIFPNLPDDQRNQLNAMGGKVNPLGGFSADMINEILAFSTHFLLVSMLLGFGHKLANLGTNLLRPVEIKVTQSKIPTTLS